ncbi:hypothetical protein QEH52_03260 [Coraliomargarita sp. SDUM461003]|uniref:PEP-CTERM protein-sorting domain-containing protein n=1 Tax=Thalassobacterium maritimum TaxID=3041265 RepID=A0ABU1AQY7_9BACT|nr:hypothetical protein [Coraliomargarita sp. SDUM461003]MDQ8206511.1 hypothetical protein [Coraliomargarita sp. SDUM461003]
MIKKTLTFALLSLSLCASSLMATYQYGDYVDSEYVSYDKKGKSEALTAATDGSLTLEFVNSQDHCGTDGGDISEWKTLTVKSTDSKGQVSSQDIEISGDWENGSFFIDIGEFSQGDSLLFYVTDARGNTTDISKNKNNYIGYEEGKKGVEDAFTFGGKYGYKGKSKVEFAFRVSGTQPASGQPLPGVAASMLMGSAGLYWVKRRKATVSAKSSC